MALLQAAAMSSVLKVKSALEYGANVNFQDASQSNWSALHFAAYSSSYEKTAERVCKMLITHGADVNLKAIDGSTALLAACSVGSFEVVKLLVGKNAKLDAADKSGLTPLMGAADRGACEIVQHLLENGATADLKNAKGMSACDMSLSKNRHDVVAVIESFLIGQTLEPSIGIKTHRIR